MGEKTPSGAGRTRSSISHVTRSSSLNDSVSGSHCNRPVRNSTEINDENGIRAVEPLATTLKFKNLMNLKLKARKARRFDRLESQQFSSLHSSSLNSLRASDGEREPLNRGSYGTFSEDVQSDHGLRELDNVNALREILVSNPLNLLLALVPLACVAEILNISASSIFLLSFFSILPLAQLLGDFTEEVALYTNETIGGLINATLGNATEMIISVFAIRKGLLRVVQVSLLGSVLSNQLLVTGCCFLFGGLYHSEQHFNPHIAAIDSSLLLMAVLGLTVPAAFSATEQMDCNVPCNANEIVAISHATAIMLFSLYLLLLFFQLKTHKHLMGHEKTLCEDDELEEEAEQASMTLGCAIGALCVTTILVAVCSEFLVNSLEEVSAKWGLSEVFIGLIMLPIIGNAAEHATAVTVAIKGKMDLALGVALGSSVQIALCVVPALCLIGWSMGKPLTLDFHPFETIILVVSVLVVNSTVMNGTSTWLDGVMLAVSYCIIGVAYFFRRETKIMGEITCVCGTECCIP